MYTKCAQQTVITGPQLISQLTLVVLKQEYSRSNQSKPWLLMTWWRKEISTILTMQNNQVLLFYEEIFQLFCMISVSRKDRKCNYIFCFLEITTHHPKGSMAYNTEILNILFYYEEIHLHIYFFVISWHWNIIGFWNSFLQKKRKHWL